MKKQKFEQRKNNYLKGLVNNMNPVLIGAKLNLKRSALQGKEEELNVFLKSVMS